MSSTEEQLEELIQKELLPTYLRYYRLLNISPPLTVEQRRLLKLPMSDLCALVKPKEI